MIIQVLKNDTYKDEESLPKSATERSTGKDIVSTSDPEIVGVKNKIWDYYYDSIDYIQYRTNLFVSVQKDTTFGVRGSFEDYDVLGFPRSSISKYNLMLANSICLIDADYRGEVLLRFKYIWQPSDMFFYHDNSVTGKLDLNKIYKKGDKICQLKITKSENVSFKLVDVLDDTNRGTGGFGSTDTSIKIPTHITDLYQSSPTLTPKTKYSDLVKEREK